MNFLQSEEIIFREKNEIAISALIDYFHLDRDMLSFQDVHHRMRRILFPRIACFVESQLISLIEIIHLY